MMHQISCLGTNNSIFADDIWSDCKEADKLWPREVIGEFKGELCCIYGGINLFPFGYSRNSLSQMSTGKQNSAKLVLLLRRQLLLLILNRMSGFSLTLFSIEWVAFSSHSWFLIIFLRVEKEQWRSWKTCCKKDEQTPGRSRVIFMIMF